MSNNFVYIIMHGMYYEYENILMICSNYDLARKTLVEEILIEYEKEREEIYVETKKDYWEYNDFKYFSINKHEVFE